jgi:hypothetical protein
MLVLIQFLATLNIILISNDSNMIYMPITSNSKSLKKDKISSLSFACPWHS